MAASFSLEKGAIRTSIDLIKKAGNVVKEYIAGHTKPFMNPVKYYLLTMTIWQLVALWTGGLGDLAEGFAVGMVEVDKAGSITDVLATYFVVGLAGLVVVWTLLSRVVFLKAKLNLAEHAVFYLYLFGLFAIYQAIVFGLLSAAIRIGETVTIGMTGAALLLWFFWVIQVIRAARVTFGRSWWQSIFGSVVVLSIGLVIYTAVMGLAIAAFVTL